ncbi:MAG: SURF1 family protein [Rhizobiaceae bacterium]|nr:MAG: SURF1 family protein [Rhizobiaceae bacterium]
MAEAAGGATRGSRFPFGFAIFSIAALALLIALGTWQVKRLAWKEGLLATIHERIHAAPRPLADLEKQFARTHDVEYWPVTARGTFLNGSERDFLATWKGASGFFVYTPLKLDDGRFLFVNRGFVPYDRKDPSTRPAGEVTREVTVTGLARDPLAEKPSSLVPDNDLAKNIFYWKDIKAMAATAGLPAGATVLPFFVDANDAPNPGGLPVGGVTYIDLPNNHFQYALTWYGLAAMVAALMVLRLWRWKHGEENP